MLTVRNARRDLQATQEEFQANRATLAGLLLWSLVLLSLAATAPGYESFDIAMASAGLL